MNTKWNLLMVLVLLAALLAVLVPAQPVQADDVAIKFIQVSAGQWHTCALSEDGIISCWGADDGTGRTIPPGGVLFKQVDVASWHSCGLTRDGNILCWGEENGGRVSDIPAGTFTQISVADWHGCGLRTDGTVDCWGINEGGRASDPPGTFKQISSANWHNCGVLTDRHAYCWGIEDDGRMTPPADTLFEKVSAAPWHTCGLTRDGNILCWGNNGAGRAREPNWWDWDNGCRTPQCHTYTDISAGWWHTCGLGYHPCGYYGDYSPKAHCWGSNDDGRLFGGPSFYLNVAPWENIFSSIDAGPRHTCAIMVNTPPFYYPGGIITCWGNNDQGQAPSRVYIQSGPYYEVNSTDPTNDHSCTNVHCTLRGAIETATRRSVSSTLNLTAGSVYMLQEDAGDGTAFRISTRMEIDGKGAIIKSSLAALRMAVVDSTGELLLKNVTVQDFHTSTLYGGVIYNNGIVTISGSTLVNNYALRGGAILNNGTLTIADSTLTNNMATQYGGAIANYPSKAITVLSSTFANNHSLDGGALKNDGTLTLKNTLLVKGTSGANCAGNAPESGSIGNMADDSSCGASAAARTTAEINLGGLVNNDGPTPTMALLAGSQAIDQGDTTACQNRQLASHDQRGYNRFADGPDGDTVAQCDIGAFEYGSSSVVQSPTDDTTAPLVSIQQAPEMPDGTNGWYRSPVTLQPSAFDEFEVIELRCALDPAIPPATFDDLPQERCPFLEGAAVSADGPHTFYAAALDINGNWSEVLSAGIQIDATPPEITCPVAGPFLLHSGDQPVGPAGVDASVSGLDEAASTLSGIVATDSVGPKSLTFTAFDLAGNSASQACSYNVIYDFPGFYPPVEPAPALNEAKAGQVIPLKFSLAGDQGLEVIAAGSPASQPVACDTREPYGPLETVQTPGQSGLSYDPLTGWYNYAWKTDKDWVGTCQALTIELLDGTQHLAYFQFK